MDVRTKGRKVKVQMDPAFATVVAKALRNESERRRSKISDLVGRTGKRPGDPTPDQAQLILSEAEALEWVASEMESQL